MDLLRKNPFYWGKAAAGIMIFCGKEILLTLRSDEVENPGVWGIPGGSVHGEEFFDSKQARPSKLPEEIILKGALKEVQEEVGSIPKTLDIFDKVVFKDGSFTYTTFLAYIPKRAKSKWKIRLNWENDKAEWFPVTELPNNLHSGIIYVMKKRQKYFKKK